MFVGTNINTHPHHHHTNITVSAVLRAHAMVSHIGRVQIGVEPQVCWHYADIVGVRKKKFKDTLLDHPEWTASSAGVVY